MEARMGPGRAQAPARLASARVERQRAVAAEAVIVVDPDCPAGERGGVEAGEEAGTAAAIGAAAGLQPQRPPADADLRIGAEPARIGEPEAQLGAGEVGRASCRERVCNDV